MNFRLLAALLAASEASTFDLENTPYGDRIENRWNLLRRWVKENLKGHTSATKTAENPNVGLKNHAQKLKRCEAKSIQKNRPRRKIHDGLLQTKARQAH